MHGHKRVRYIVRGQTHIQLSNINSNEVMQDFKAAAEYIFGSAKYGAVMICMLSSFAGDVSAAVVTPFAVVASLLSLPFCHRHPPFLDMHSLFSDTNYCRPGDVLVI